MTVPAIDPIGAAQAGVGLLKACKDWWRHQRPICRLLEGVADNRRLVRIFIRDFFVPPGSPLLAHGPGGVGYVPNVIELWPRVEGLAMASIFSVLGRVGKTANIEVVEMSKDPGLWDSDIIVLGAQAQKCFDFYTQMQHVAYRMDNAEIRDAATNAAITRESGYGYGIILKTRNPHHASGIGFLIGGYGVLGTEAAAYYFRKHAADLGRLFGKKGFGIIVRASVTAGIESTMRLKDFDRSF